MGAFVEDPEVPPAPEPVPENAFDPQLFTSRIVDALKEKWPVLLGPAGIAVDLTRSDIKGNIALFSLLGELILKAQESGAAFFIPILQVVLQAVMTLLRPGMDVLGTLTHSYVTELARSGLTTRPGQPSVGRGPAGDATATVFDQIMAPLLNLLTPANPATPGAGETNAQHILGTIISLHLSTWMINILSNVSGLGILKWINSFEDAVTAGINARSFSRLASRPYLDKFVVTPGTRDLNLRYPLELGSVSQLVKRYIRGNISQEELKRILRGKGYDDAVVEDLLLDTAKMLSLGALGVMVKQGFWSDADAVQHLEQQGYPHDLAEVMLWMEVNDLAFSQERSLANSLVDAFIDRRIDNPTLRYLLEKAGFTADEVNAFVTRGAILQELPKRLSRADVVALYNESLVDLTYVRTWLEEEGYAYQDAELLELLYFCRKEEREERKAEQLNRRRIALESALGMEEEADALRQAELLRLGT